MHRFSSENNGLQLNKEQGYSAYFFDDNPSDYCIIDQEYDYSKERLYINTGGMVLVLAIMFATPVILGSVYDSFRVKVKKNTNMMYFVWSIATVSFVAAMVMMCVVSSTIISNIKLYPTHKENSGYYDVFIYFTLSAVVLFIMVIGDIVLMIIALVYVKPVGDKSFPIPLLFKVVPFCCGRAARTARRAARAAVRAARAARPLLRGERVDGGGAVPEQDEHRPLLGDDEGAGVAHGNEGGAGLDNPQQNNSECLVLLFGCVSFTLFLQLSSFHSVYILLGTICTPVPTLSITSFYIATYFCLVAFVAVVLKCTDDTNLKVGTIISVISAVLFTICVVLLVLYFYNYTVMVQGYHNTGGIFGIVGSILPSIIVVFGGWCGTRLMKCIKPVRNDEPQLPEDLLATLHLLQQQLRDGPLPPIQP